MIFKMTDHIVGIWKLQQGIKYWALYDTFQFENQPKLKYIPKT